MTIAQLRKLAIDQAAERIASLDSVSLFGYIPLHNSPNPGNEWIAEELDILQREIVAKVKSLSSKNRLNFGVFRR
jgi:hypothetical protein